MKKILIFSVILAMAAVGIGIATTSDTHAATKACTVCKGSRKCYNCGGTGKGSTIYLMGRSQTMPCFACNGTGKCASCNGTGNYTPPAGGGSYHGGGGTSGGSHSHNSNNGVCTACGGLGYRKAVSYENDPSGAAFHLRELMQNQRGNKCSICGRYTYHCHMKCYKCN